MQKILIIGDSHSAHLLASVFHIAGMPEDSYSWENKHNFIFLEKFLVQVSLYDGTSAYSLEYDQYEDSSTIIAPFFGEIDIRKNLKKYNNTEDVVDAYIDKTLRSFPDNKIIFIEPVPPSDNALGSFGSIEERVNFYNEFVYFLRKKSIEMGLLPPVPVSEYLGKNVLSDSDLQDDAHLNHENANLLFFDIINHIEKELSINTNLIFTRFEEFKEIADGIWLYKNFFTEDDKDFYSGILNNYTEEDWTKHGNYEDQDHDDVFWLDKLSLDIIRQDVTTRLINLVAPIHWTFQHSNFVRMRSGQSSKKHEHIPQHLHEYESVAYIGNWEGGEINFSNLNFKYKPESGDLIIFKADKKHEHSVDEVTSGVRYAYIDFLYKHPGYFAG